MLEIVQNACLGIQSLGDCRYDQLHPASVYFSIGESVSAIAILVAFLSLMTDRIRFRLWVSKWIPLIAIGTLLAGFVSTVIAALLPILVHSPWPLLGYPLFWEVAGGTLDVVGVGALLWRFFRPVRYSTQNAPRYFRACFLAIGRGKQSEMVDLAVEILPSVSRIVRIAQKVSWSSPTLIARATEKAKHDSQYAISMLELFADETFCRRMVESAAITAVNLLRDILKASSDRSWGSELVDQLIRQAITSKHSALRRERGFSGLGRFKSFQTEIFRPRENAARLFDRLSWSAWSAEEPDVEAHETYCDCLLEAFEGYIDAGFDSASVRGLSNGFQGLLNFYVSSLWNATELAIEEEKLRSTAAFKCAGRSQRLLQDCLAYLLKHSVDTLQTFLWPNAEARPDDNKVPQARTIYDCLADAMFAHFASLSSCKSGWRSLRETACSLWREAGDLGTSSPGAVAGLNVQDRLVLQLRSRLNENVRNHGYAPITRTLVSVMGIRPSATDRGFFEGELRTALRQIVSNELGRYEKVDNMLPDYVTWDSVAGAFVDAYRPKRQRIIPFDHDMN